MRIPIDISFRNVDRTEALAEHIQLKVMELEEVYDQILRCEVVVEVVVRRKHRGIVYNVQVQMLVPNRILQVGYDRNDQHQHENPEIAVEFAFEAMRRQLNNYLQEQTELTKRDAGCPHGKVTKICLSGDSEGSDHGYGLISTCDGREFYFDASRLQGIEFHRLELGSEVDFVEELGDDGPQATFVRLAGRQIHSISA